MIGLETERLVYRQWRESDFPVFEAFFCVPENTRFLGGVKRAEESWRLMATYIGHYHLHGYSYLPLEEKKSKKLVGTVGLWNSTPWPEPELGYWLLPEFQGQGYGTEAALTLKAFAKEKVKLKSLVSYISGDNLPSKQLAMRIGASHDGTLELLNFGRHEVYRYK